MKDKTDEQIVAEAKEIQSIKRRIKALQENKFWKPKKQNTIEKKTPSPPSISTLPSSS